MPALMVDMVAPGISLDLVKRAAEAIKRAGARLGRPCAIGSTALSQLYGRGPTGVSAAELSRIGKSTIAKAELHRWLAGYRAVYLDGDWKIS